MSLRIALTIKMTDEEKYKLRLEEIEKLLKKCLKAQQQIKLYQARISAAHKKKIKVRTFKKSDLILAVRRPMNTTHKTKEKFQPKW